MTTTVTTDKDTYDTWRQPFGIEGGKDRKQWLDVKTTSRLCRALDAKIPTIFVCIFRHLHALIHHPLR